MVKLSLSTRIFAAIGAIWFPAVLVALAWPESTYAQHMIAVTYGAMEIFVIGAFVISTFLLARMAIKGTLF
jgi:hypothetical protein